MSYESDDDYELPSLSERILLASQAKEIINSNRSLHNKDVGALKSPEKISSTPSVQTLVFTSDSSDSEDVFSNLVEKFGNLETPRVKSNFKHNEASDSADEPVKVLGSVCSTSCTPCLVEQDDTDDSDDDIEFSNILERVCNTPCTPYLGKHNDLSDSDDESEFLNILERVRSTPRTPYSVTRKIVSDSPDESKFLKGKICPQLSLRTKSDSHLLPDVAEKRKLLSDSNAFLGNTNSLLNGTPAVKSVKAYKTAAEEEYYTLFPPECRTELTTELQYKYAKQLYDFYNKNIFASKLPENMPLIWDNLLLRTAGVTRCSMKGGVRDCFIRLSPKLLSCFGHLQDTLLHEMCHAAVFLISQRNNVVHGPLWQVWASRCNMILPSVECPSRCHNYELDYRVVYLCTSCNFRVKRLKRSRKLENAKCRNCRIPLTMEQL